MAIDVPSSPVEVPDTVGESAEVAADVRDELLEQLAAQRDYMLPMFAWYDGRQDPPIVPERYRGAYQLLLGMSTRAWPRLIIEAISERLEIEGVVADDDQLESTAWNLLQANHIDADQRLVHRETLIAGRGYVGIADTDAGPRLTPESALQVTHAEAPGDPRTLMAGLKVFPVGRLTEAVWRAELYTPQSVWAWEVELDDDDPSVIAHQPDSWDGSEGVRSANALGYVPFVPFENRPLILSPGRSELHELIPIFRSIDFIVLNLLLAADTAAFRQKWATGLEVPIDPATGKPVEPFKAAVDRLWIAPGEEGKDVKFGTFEASDVAQYIQVVDSFVAELAAISRVPAYYLLSQTLANPPSAESLVAGESGLVFKVRDRQAQFGESWERVTRRAMELVGAKTDTQLQVLWRAPAQRSPGQISDAAVKLQSIGVPQEALWAYVGYTPEQIDRMRAQATEEAFVQAAAAAAAAPPQTGAVG